jgi:hypothetical protein
LEELKREEDFGEEERVPRGFKMETTMFETRNYEPGSDDLHRNSLILLEASWIS